MRPAAPILQAATAGAVINDPSHIYLHADRSPRTALYRNAGRPGGAALYQASRPFMEFHVRRRRDILDADLVVDASGRASRTPDCLQRNGFSSPPVKHVAAASKYSSQLMNIPNDRITQRMASPVDHASTATRLLLLGYEHDTWILSVGHAVGRGEPPTDSAEMFATAEPSLPTTIMAGLRDATPIGDVAVFRNTAATWRRQDTMPRHPGSVVVIGDTLCSCTRAEGRRDDGGRAGAHPARQPANRPTRPSPPILLCRRTHRSDLGDEPNQR